MSQDLTRLFLGLPTGVGTQLLMPGTCTAWDAGTKHSTITVGTVTYTNLPIVNAALATMATGTVLLINTPGSPIILGLLTVPT